MNDSETVTVEGRIERILFHNPDNQYTVAHLAVRNQKLPIPVVGFIPNPNVGSRFRVTGTWDKHTRYGVQLKITSCEPKLPETESDIRQYLKSGFLEGIPKKVIHRIVSTFGTDTFDIIENHPERLTEVDGIGKATAEKIASAYMEHHGLHRLMRLLEKAAVPVSYAARIYRQYGAKSAAILTENPYQAAFDLPGWGFYVADRIAQSLGFPADTPSRSRACLLYVLEMAAGEGHTAVEMPQLAHKMTELFQIEGEAFEAAFRQLVTEGTLVCRTVDGFENDLVYLAHLFEAERRIAAHVDRFLKAPVPVSRFDRQTLIQEVIENLAIEPSAQQAGILEAVLQHRMAIITGGPGTGKTTLVRAVCALFKRLGKSVFLAAPTGRAARRLAEVSGREARTIHRMLLYDPDQEGFQKSEKDPLEADVVIVDEASMVDVALMRHLMDAVPTRGRLILVGDRFQLPSVGPGNVLSDLIDADVIPVFELTEIFRQAAESPIIRNAHRVRAGRMPVMERNADPDELQEFYIIEQGSAETAARQIVEMVTRRIPDTFGYDPIRDIQVLTPMHKGIVGTIALNQALQQALNPESPGFEIFGTTFRIRDKVMHLRNNHQKEVYNGDIGIVEDFDKRHQKILVRYEDRPVAYEKEEIQELTPAYAITVHKSQGSEYPAVILPLMSMHYPMLQRNLLYTALTRGKRLVVLIGTQQAIRTAVENNRASNRLSTLKAMLTALTG
ncbi:MAG: ATP-dependent RecD-like DNA helicase [Thermodesulfobacteriota bacterium]